jgi:hypothetical protein
VAPNVGLDRMAVDEDETTVQHDGRLENVEMTVDGESCNKCELIAEDTATGSKTTLVDVGL